MTQNKKQLIINTDGGARGNPGPAGIGVVIADNTEQVVYQHGEYIGETTNNVAEYKALLHALQIASDMMATDLLIRMDSELIVKQMTGEYKIKEPTLQEIASDVKKLLSQFNNYKFEHVRREYNKAADSMVNLAIDEALGK